MGNFLIFDAHAIIHRAYHALPPLKTRKGVLVNAVYGFLLVFLKVLKEFEPKYLAVCFDTPAETFRDKLYRDYKAQRAETDADLAAQFPLVKDILHAFSVSAFELDGYEADDCIGTLVNWGKKHLPKNQMIIVTGDMDTLQLIDQQVKVYTLRKGMSDTVLYTPAMVQERFGVTPEQLVDWKALKGDPSDNIPGVTGIGDKTATELIQKFHSLKDLYAHLTEVDSEAVRQKLVRGEKDAQISKQLATIVENVPLKLHVNDVEFGGFEEEKVIAKFQEFDFNSLIARIPAMKEQGQFFFKQKGSQQSTVNKQREKKLKRHPEFAVPRSEPQGSTTGDSARLPDGQGSRKKKQKEKDLKSFGFLDSKLSRLGMTEGGRGREATMVKLAAEMYSKLEHDWQTRRLVVRTYLDEQKKYVLTLSVDHTVFVVHQKELQNHRTFLTRILSSHEIKKIGHDLKYNYKALKGLEFTLYPLWFDCKIAAYLLDPGKRSYELLELFAEYVGVSSIGQLRSTRSEERILDGLNILWLYEKLDQELAKRGHTNLFHSFEMPLVSILADMEMQGILLDVSYLKKFSKELREKIGVYTKKIIKLAGVTFNMNSPKQLKEVLFEKLGISARNLGRTKTGISTGAGELEKIRDAHPIVPLILEYRECFKLLSTYVDALPKLVDKDKRVHTTFNQTVTATGRLSSQDPNLQNIPIRTGLGRRMRKAFIAPRGWKLVSADYSQFELRVVASLSRDPVLVKAFRSGGDIHTRTASVIFNVPLNKVTPLQRRDAKTINFGIIYGLGARGLAQTTGMSTGEAKDFIRKYFEIHKGVKKFFDKLLQDARERGYVETLFGRRRYLPDLNAPQEFLRSAAERMALNHPIQGSQADLLKLAMVHLHRRFAEGGLLDDVHMLLQVHDELVFEVRQSKVAEVHEIIHHELVHVYKLWVPIEVEIGIGRSWDECHR